jgi:hypothetical protein
VRLQALAFGIILDGVCATCLPEGGDCVLDSDCCSGKCGTQLATYCGT